MTDEMMLWQGAKIAMPFIYRFLQEKRKKNACRELTKHII